jgi:putative redox protein
MSEPTTDEAVLSVEPGWIKVVESGEGKFTEHLLDGRHRLSADEPVTAGGNDRGPGPYELLLMALGACTTMTLRLYADRKRWPLARVSVQLRHNKIHAEDCADCETKQGMLDRIERVIALEGTLDAAQRQRLLEIADMCPVHRTLTSEIKIETRMSGAAGVSP